MTNIVINGRTAVHAGSGGTLTTPDVCKTPKYCRPVNYTNIAVSADAGMTAVTVKINGNPACHQKSIFVKSSGDEAGRCGGIVSGTIKQIAEFVTFSPNVFIEGIPAVRQLDLMTSNLKNTPPMPLMQPGAGMPPPLKPKGAQDSEATTGKVMEWEVVGDEIHFMKGLVNVLEEFE